jgi:hypothetical protein
MSSLTRFDKDGIELIINTTTGESFASVSGYARMVGKQESTIRSRVQRMSEGERNTLTKTAEIHTPGGTQGGRLLGEELIVQWLPQDNADMASKVMRLGVRVFMHKVAGYEIKSTAVDLNNPPELIAARQCVEIYQNLEQFNPRLAQLFTDKLANRVVHGENTLPEADRLMGVVEIAEDMGLKVPPNFASSLGRYVSQRCESVAKVEKRLVNGRWCDTKLYPTGNEYVKGAIVEYLRAKEIA